MAAWKTLMDQVMRERAPRLLGYGVVLTGNAADAEDLLHDAILKTFSRTARFEHVNAAEQYVRRTMRTLVVDGHRSRGALQRALTRTKDPAPHSPDVDAGMDVRQALQELPARERVCVVMRFYDDLTVPEIARQLGLAPGTVKRYLHQAQATLEQLLDVNTDWLDLPETVPVTAAHKEER